MTPEHRFCYYSQFNHRIVPLQIIEKGSFEPISVPHTFIRKKPEVVLNWAQLTDEQKDEFEKHKNLIMGDESEEAAFTNFARLFRRPEFEDLRIVSFNGVEFLFPDASYRKEITGEYDQIIVVEYVKAVFYVEYKRTFSGNHARKKRQFEKFRSLLQTHFPFGEGWKLVTSYGFSKWPDSCAEHPWAKCMEHVFMVENYDQMEAWFDNMLAKLKGCTRTCGPICPKMDVFFTFSALRE